MKAGKENEASLLPGNMTDSAFIELWAAITEVVVMYSPRWIGARATCSPIVRALDTASCRTGRATELPPKTAWSTANDVTLAALVAIPLATEN